MTGKWRIEMRTLKSLCRGFLGRRSGKLKILRPRNNRRIKLTKYCIVVAVSGVEVPSTATSVLIKNTLEIKKKNTHNFCFSKSVVFT